MNIIVSVANNIIACVGVACNACLDPMWRSITNTERRVAVHPATQSLSRLRICRVCCCYDYYHTTYYVISTHILCHFAFTKCVVEKSHPLVTLFLPCHPEYNEGSHVA